MRKHYEPMQTAVRMNEPATGRSKSLHQLTGFSTSYMTGKTMRAGTMFSEV